jgi:hypothetical protein
VQSPTDVTDSSTEPLPEFLSGEEGQASDVGESEAVHAVAAE